MECMGDVVVVKESKCLFIGDQVYIEYFCICVWVFWDWRYGIEVSFWVYEEWRLRAR